MLRYRAGIDIGSTTVKLVILDENNGIVFSDYRRHRAHTQETLAELLREQGVMTEEQMQAIRAEISAKIDAAVATAEATPEPTPEDLYRNLYAEQR